MNHLERLYAAAAASVAAYTAAAIVETALECGDDPTTYALDDVDSVKYYLDELAPAVAALLPDAVKAVIQSKLIAQGNNHG